MKNFIKKLALGLALTITFTTYASALFKNEIRLDPKYYYGVAGCNNYTGDLNENFAPYKTRVTARSIGDYTVFFTKDGEDYFMIFKKNCLFALIKVPKETKQVTQPRGAPETATSVNDAQSLLLEESSNGTTGAAPFNGSVEWSRGVDKLGSPTIIAKANIPARNLGVELLIRRNSDQSLPASHLMEINFIASDSFVGGSVEGMLGILLKNEELVQGTPLVGASAQVVKNLFLFALSANEQDITKNTKLLKDQNRMDIALVYETGKRAIITLEKDAAALRIFNEVFASWAETQ